MLSFQEYLELFAQRSGALLARRRRATCATCSTSTAREQTRRPWGTTTRFRLFDLPFLRDGGGDSATRSSVRKLVQSEIYRALSQLRARGPAATACSCCTGPNGSAKSTVAACIMRALEHYSTLDEGALYRFHWVFPEPDDAARRHRLRRAAQRRGAEATAATRTSTTTRSTRACSSRCATIRCSCCRRAARAELLDAPLRRGRRQGAAAATGSCAASSRTRASRSSRRCSPATSGSLAEVLRHVQVERYFISRRYRVGAVTLGPQLSVDAGERQITADRSLAALPRRSRRLTLFEAYGELIDAAGGVLEFSDLLKRPLDAFKYLQITVETGEVALRSRTCRSTA